MNKMNNPRLARLISQLRRMDLVEFQNHPTLPAANVTIKNVAHKLRDEFEFSKADSLKGLTQQLRLDPLVGRLLLAPWAYANRHPKPLLKRVIERAEWADQGLAALMACIDTQQPEIPDQPGQEHMLDAVREARLKLNPGHADLAQRYEDWVANISARELTTYDCPRCRQGLLTRSPRGKEQWDTLATCPSCFGLHFKYVTASGCLAVVVES